MIKKSECPEKSQQISKINFFFIFLHEKGTEYTYTDGHRDY